MTITETAFDKNTLEYDNWFEKHSNTYQSEILALKEAIPMNKKGLEIGSGTGRFSLPFNIRIGVEPSFNMSKLAEQKGMTIINAVAENLPFHNLSFDFALMVTTVCFLSDIPKAFSEVHRILKPQGEIILAIIDKNSELGKKYEIEKSENKFYKDVSFYTLTVIFTTLLVFSVLALTDYIYLIWIYIGIFMAARELYKKNIIIIKTNIKE